MRAILWQGIKREENEREEPSKAAPAVAKARDNNRQSRVETERNKGPRHACDLEQVRQESLSPWTGSLAAHPDYSTPHKLPFPSL